MHGGSLARIDLYSGPVWIALGGAILYGSWTMDRLEYLNINPYTAPGLLSGILGLAIMACGFALIARSIHAGADLRPRPADAPAPVDSADAEPGGVKRAAISLLLCVGFAIGLVGRGPPFWFSAALFVFLHILVFELPERRARGEVGRGIVVALACAIGASAAISFIFQELFLVRLP